MKIFIKFILPISFITLIFINSAKSNDFQDYLEETGIKNWSHFLFLHNNINEVLEYNRDLKPDRWEKIIGIDGYPIAWERTNNLESVKDNFKRVSSMKPIVPTNIYKWNIKYEYDYKYNVYFWYFFKYIELHNNYNGFDGDTSLIGNKYNSVGKSYYRNPKLDMFPLYKIIDTSKHFYSPLLGREYRFFLSYDVIDKSLKRNLEFINSENVKICANVNNYKNTMVYKGDNNLGFYLWYKHFGENCYFSSKSSSIICYNEKIIPDYYRIVFVGDERNKKNDFYEFGYNASSLWSGKINKKKNETLEKYFLEQIKYKENILILVPYEKTKEFVKFINRIYNSDKKALFKNNELKNGYIWLLNKNLDKDDYRKNRYKKYHVLENDILNNQIKEIFDGKIKVRYGDFLLDNITVLDLINNKINVEYVK